MREIWGRTLQQLNVQRGDTVWWVTSSPTARTYSRNGIPCGTDVQVEVGIIKSENASGQTRVKVIASTDECTQGKTKRFTSKSHRFESFQVIQEELRMQGINLRGIALKGKIGLKVEMHKPGSAK